MTLFLLNLALEIGVKMAITNLHVPNSEKAYILIEESDEDRTLEYLLEDAVGNFSSTFNEIQRNREMEPPF